MTKLMKLSVIALLTATLGLVGCGDDETSGTGATGGGGSGGAGATGGSGGAGATGGSGGAGGMPLPRGCPALEGEVSSTNVVICTLTDPAPIDIPVNFITFATSGGMDLVVDSPVDVTTCMDIVIDPALVDLVISFGTTVIEASFTLGVTNSDPAEIAHTIPGLPIEVTPAVSTDEVTTALSALDVGDVVIAPTAGSFLLDLGDLGEIPVEVGAGNCTDFMPEGDPITFQAIVGP